MDTLGTNQEHLESIKSRLLEKGFNLSPEDVNGVVGLIKDEIGYWHVSQLIPQVEKILERS